MMNNVLFCGLTTVDIQYFVDKFPESNQKIKTQLPILCVGGPAANAAITHSFLGGKSSLLTGIGKNHFSGFIIDELLSSHIEVIDLAKGQDFKPIIASIITTLNNGDRSVISHFPQPIFSNEKRPEEIVLDHAEMILIDGFYPEAAIIVCEKARKKGIPVIFDGGSWKPLTDDLLPFVDVALCSEQFLPPGCISTTDTIEFLQQKGINKIAITRGEKNIICIEKKECNSIPIKGIQAIDSLGSGDVFHGAFTWFYLKNDSFFHSLQKASITASFSTLFKGTREWMEKFTNDLYKNW